MFFIRDFIHITFATQSTIFLPCACLNTQIVGSQPKSCNVVMSLYEQTLCQVSNCPTRNRSDTTFIRAQAQTMHRMRWLAQKYGLEGPGGYHRRGLRGSASICTGSSARGSAGVHPGGGCKYQLRDVQVLAQGGGCPVGLCIIRFLSPNIYLGKCIVDPSSAERDSHPRFTHLDSHFARMWLCLRLLRRNKEHSVSDLN